MLIRLPLYLATAIIMVAAIPTQYRIGKQSLCGDECSRWSDCEQEQCGCCLYGACRECVEKDRLAVTSPPLIPLGEWPGVEKLTNHKAVSGVVAGSGASAYYSIQWGPAMVATSMTFTLTQHIIANPLSLVVSGSGQLATINEHEYSNTTKHLQKTITILHPHHAEEADEWSLAVVNGNVVHINFSIQVDVQFDPPKCINSCSGHGTCEYNTQGVPTCHCDEDHGGPDCSAKNYLLSNNEPLSVTLDYHNYVYFTIVLKNPPMNNMTLTVQGFSHNDSAVGPSIYASFTNYPTVKTFNFSDNRTILSKSLTILNPDVGIWYVALYGQQPGELVLTVVVNIKSVCFSNCSSHGSCHLYKDEYVGCECEKLFTGKYCSAYNTTMRNTTLYTGQVWNGFWSYWYFNITGKGRSLPGSSLVVSVSAGSLDIVENITPPDLYLQYQTTPTKTSYYCHNHSNTEYKSSANVTRSCVVNEVEKMRSMDKWYIGVLGTGEGNGMYRVTVIYYNGTAREHILTTGNDLF